MFIAHIIQKSEECDYTIFNPIVVGKNISCGEILIRLDAENKKDATQELKDKILNYYYYESNIIKKATIFEISDEINIPVDLWYIEAKNLKEEKKNEEEKEARRKLYNELKNEFN